jgi:YidC/Oxa1 family membrane protein insertase
MPDLQNFIFKKSPLVKKYIYVFHALVSTHQQYRSHAFDHYDAIFCTGPQPETEIREAEQLYALPPKDCVAYGYPLLQDLKEKFGSSQVNKSKLLIAPSWYNKGILSTCILPLVEELVKELFEIWIRPHPEFLKRNKKVYRQLLKKMEGNKRIRFDTTPSVYTHLADAGHLITDRSGIALEYALSTYRPVMFIDTPLKIQNTEVGRFSVEPLENACRSRIGASVLPNELSRVRDLLHQLESSAADYKASIQSLEEDIVYPPSYWQNGTNYIKTVLGL